MSAVSDQLLVAAILAYLVAMVCHAAEYAFGVRGPVARVAAAPARELVAVGAASPAEPAPPAPAAEPAPPAPPPVRDRARLAGRVAVAVTVLGVLAHLGCLVTRGVAAGRVPWGNMYEFVLAVTFVGATAWLVVLARRPALRHLGLFVALTEVVLLGIAGMVLYTKVEPLVAALNSYWLKVHVTAAVLASGTFLVGFVAGAMYLVRAGYEQGKRSFPYTLGPRVPRAEALERLTFRLHAFAFPIWTFAVIAGAIWAEAAWGRYWGWDPKEIWAFISWV
ncbi:MAG: cytochrome c biogenesis protein CcsA, partial [Micromonosporaceae bacterium]|nr:cytochrome c biogenesis protein CcsA [Micromonosporaceae bacterium]